MISRIDDFDLELEPEHLACLAVYGDAARNGFGELAYNEDYIENFTGQEDIGDKLESLHRINYLEKTSIEIQMYRLRDDQKVRDEAASIMEYADEEYAGRINEFLEDFDEEDKETLVEDGVEIAGKVELDQ